MRLAVLDVGSNTVHLLVVDAHEGARPLPAHSDKAELRLAEHLTDDGHIDDTGQSRLIECVKHALEVAEDRGTEDLVAFATSALRDAPNGPEVLAAVRDETGVDLEVLTGNDEARLTFLAVRRWFGWSSGRLMVIDIGGGSLELAAGIDELPDAVASLPLGAGRLTRAMLPGRPAVRVRRQGAARSTCGRRWPASCARSRRSARPTTSSAPPRRSSSWPGWPGRRVRRRASAFLGCCSLADLDKWVPKLAAMTYDERAELPGVSTGRAPQLLAGAIVAEAVMSLLDVEEVQVCPWALREGIILRRLDWIRPDD